jgi:hypothetical protein
MVSISWTVEEALAANEAALIENPSRSFDPTLPLYQWKALKRLILLREQYEQGEKFALMLAIRECANHDLVMPQWVASNYITAFDTNLNYRSKDWNEVFGNPIPKGLNLDALRKRRVLEYGVLNEVRDILKCDPSQAIDAGLFERVGEKFNIGKTLTEDYYYSAAKKMGYKTSKKMS